MAARLTELLGTHGTSGVLIVIPHWALRWAALQQGAPALTEVSWGKG